MKGVISANSQQGKREYQQDKCGHIRVGNTLILAVADGNGGEGGDVLAESAVKAVISELCMELSLSHHPDAAGIKTLGLEAMKAAAVNAVELKKKNEWKQAGTTLTIALITDSCIGIFWVGDSSAYIYENKAIRRITTPHTLTETFKKEGIASQPSLDSVLTRCLGHEEDKADSCIIEIDRSFILFLGSDGVWGDISEAEILGMIRSKLSGSFDVDSLCSGIVEKAIINGSTDNCTLLSAACLKKQARKVQRTRVTRLYEFTSV